MNNTKIVHHPYQPPAGFAAPQVAVHKASTIVFPSVAALRTRDWRHKTGYTYGLHGTPTTFTLEERIATLEGGAQCILVPSGLAAVAVVDLCLLGQGDELLLPANVYGPSRELARRELAQWGVTHRLYDPMDPASLAAALSPRTKLVWIEAPGSITMEFPDLRRLLAIVRAHGAVSAIDNTWGAGIAYNGFDAGADIVMQALTKYPSGGGDVLMGSIVTRDDDLHQRLKLTHMRLGYGVAGNDAELVLRSLPSLALRYHAADALGRRLATWFTQRPEISRVLHPALEGAPGHEHWKSHCSAAAGLFSVMFDERYSSEQVDRFVDALKLFKIGYSWAGPVSLVVPYALPAIRDTVPFKGTLVRFSVGLEDEADLIADLQQALSALGG